MGALWLRIILLGLCLGLVLAARHRGSQLRCYKLAARVEAVRRSCTRRIVVPGVCSRLEPNCPPRTIGKPGFCKQKVRVLAPTGEPILEQPLSDLYQEIVSPRFPKPYIRNVECEWNFVVPSRHRAAITFKSFNLEKSINCTNDVVVVDGSRSPTTLCGYHERTIKLKGLKRRNVQIRFRSDSSQTGEQPTRVGFKGFFVAFARKQRRADADGVPQGRLWNDSDRSSLVFRRYDDVSGVELLDNGDIDKTLDALLRATANDYPEVLEFTEQSVDVDWSVLEAAMSKGGGDGGGGEGSGAEPVSRSK